jgi:hypothetical protein
MSQTTHRRLRGERSIASNEPAWPASASAGPEAFARAGPTHYYRLQGPTFLLEFDNSRNSGTHIHSVWRDFERDYGRHLL